MRDVEDYEDIFPSGYPDGLTSAIYENQSMLGGRTFFERLLELLNIKWRRMYPPKGDAGLRDLHKRIMDSQITLHYKHCLIFYLLKDLSPSHHTTPEISTQFARDVHLEQRFWTFIEGIWDLDHLQFETAVGHLTHPSIIPTFPDEILLTLLNRRHTLSATDETDILPLAYYTCVKPPLATDVVRTTFAKYMAARNVTETFHWIRLRPDNEHKALMEALVEQTLGRQSWGKTNMEAIYSTQEKAVELISLPLTEQEDGWLEKFLTEGKGRTFKAAEDTVAMRRIARGQLREFAMANGARGRTHNGVNWEILKDGVQKGLGPRKDEDGFVA